MSLLVLLAFIHTGPGFVPSFPRWLQERGLYRGPTRAKEGVFRGYRGFPPQSQDAEQKGKARTVTFERRCLETPRTPGKPLTYFFCSGLPCRRPLLPIARCPSVRSHGSLVAQADSCRRAFCPG